MQHELAVTVVDALGQAGGPGRVERRRAGILGQVGEYERRRRGGEHRLVLRGERDLRLWRSRPVVDQHERDAGPNLVLDRLEDRQELGVDDDDIVGRVVDRVQDLFGRNAYVDRVQHGAHHRHGEEALEIAVAVPVHHRDRRARLDAQRREGRGEAADTRGERFVRVADAVGVDDFLRRRLREAAGEDLAYRERRVVGRRRPVDGKWVHRMLNGERKMMRALTAPARPARAAVIAPSAGRAPCDRVPSGHAQRHRSEGGSATGRE